KTEQRRAARREAIIEAAAKLFADLGYDACEMERVAAKLRIAKGTLYLYFDSKEKLFCVCVDDGMRRMQAAVRDAASVQSDPLDKIAAAIRAYLKFFDEHPHNVELLIQERAIFRNRKRPSYFEHRDANRGPWREMYRELIDAGRVRADLPIERILDTLGSLLYGTMFTNHFLGRSTSTADQFHCMLQIIMGGILTDRGYAAWRKRDVIAKIDE
ncbi:MAG TPA: TetR/AcrR family transcriptional regulator, partial [Pirellulaceae bacterium]|nr:TetR/AcrR family transcriptional regulator [Pirellulaceae bacterium]